MRDLFGCEITPEQYQGKVKKDNSPYIAFKKRNQYTKSFINTTRCGVCTNHFINISQSHKRYYKCALMGNSMSPATDIRASFVCNLFQRGN